jgi:hypothetical protein
LEILKIYFAKQKMKGIWNGDFNYLSDALEIVLEEKEK